MDLAYKPKTSPGRWLAGLLSSCFSQGWITFLFDLYRALRRWLGQKRHHTMFQILDYDATLVLLDPQGETAIFEKQQRVKFLQDEVISLVYISL